MLFIVVIASQFYTIWDFERIVNTERIFDEAFEMCNWVRHLQR